MSKDENIKTAKNVATGLAFGSIIGAAAGVMLAPKSGKDLRKDISDKSTEGVEIAKEATSKQLEKAKQLAERAKPKKKEKIMVEVGRKRQSKPNKVESVDKL